MGAPSVRIPRVVLRRPREVWIISLWIHFLPPLLSPPVLHCLYPHVCPLLHIPPPIALPFLLSLRIPSLQDLLRNFLDIVRNLVIPGTWYQTSTSFNSSSSSHPGLLWWIPGYPKLLSFPAGLQVSLLPEAVSP